MASAYDSIATKLLWIRDHRKLHKSRFSDLPPVEREQVMQEALDYFLERTRMPIRRVPDAPAWLEWVEEE